MEGIARGAMREGKKSGGGSGNWLVLKIWSLFWASHFERSPGLLFCFPLLFGSFTFSPYPFEYGTVNFCYLLNTKQPVIAGFFENKLILGPSRSLTTQLLMFDSCT